jgi:DNA-binding transcriptional ArsR family regulator
MENLFDKKILSILNFFLKNESGEYYLREISRITKVSPATTYRILSKLVKLELLKLNEIKTAKLYSLGESKSIDFLKSILEVDFVQLFVDKASQFTGVEEILLLGTANKTKANVLILGSNVDAAQVKLLCGEIKEKSNYTINQMTLSREQYEQMSAMGLYPGSKKSLFRKA